MIYEIRVDRVITGLIDLLIETTSEHTELRIEDLYCRDDAEHRRNELRINRALARRDTARNALCIALSIDPHQRGYDAPPF